MSTNLVEQWRRDYRIPQGTPISALAANISMLDFDIEINRIVKLLGGSYRRYSDDILIVVPSIHRSAVPAILRDTLKNKTRRLRVNDKKTEIIEFIPGALADGPGTRALQYLGFIFDGRRTLLRSSTISKYYRRVYRAVGSAQKAKKKALSGNLHGRPVLHRRGLLANLTHLGTGNFVTTYAKNAQSTLGGDAIKRQLSRHQKKLNSILGR